MVALRNDHILVFCVVQNWAHILKLFQHSTYALPSFSYFLHLVAHAWPTILKARATPTNSNPHIGLKVMEMHVRHMSQICTLSNNYPEKNAMHAQGMLLALIGTSTWYLHETYMCHACFMQCTTYIWPLCMFLNMHVTFTTCKKLARLFYACSIAVQHPYDHYAFYM